MAYKALHLFSGMAVLAVAQSSLDLDFCSVLNTEPLKDCRPFTGAFADLTTQESTTIEADIGILEDVFEALSVLQRDYFDPDYGSWPSAIDWTGAVVETVVSGTLTTLSKSLDAFDSSTKHDWKAKENLVSFYFAQVVNSFFGQDILSIRSEAYDDILWVVLGWLEALQFIDIHAALHYPAGNADDISLSGSLKDALSSLRWHGHNWVSAFAHRARVFWRLGSDGWDTRYCNGGMVWNRRLQPYKNAITNELWISASIAMFEHFPGDNFSSPWISDIEFPRRDPVHLASATEGYRWLRGINMTNEQGLFVDGFHIDHSKPGNTECDLRDEMVYTYNQGVILTAQRGLWVATGAATYLEHGHQLIQSVINATGWNQRKGMPFDRADGIPHGQLPPWRGLGRGGILEEACDASGSCSQDGQTFKGIFFHHLTAFCKPLEQPVKPGFALDEEHYRQIKGAHEGACGSYLGWIRHNALAALKTRDSDGHFGMWWGASLFGDVIVTAEDDGIDHSATNTADYRNSGTPRDEVWGAKDASLPGKGIWTLASVESQSQAGSSQQVLGQKDPGRHGITRRISALLGISSFRQRAPDAMPSHKVEDPNDRGRGRTVETQMGGLAVTRAYWEISQGRKLAG
jgi:hypothetical protein